MPQTVTIEFQAGGHPVSGALATGTAPPRPFTGWLELMSLLQSALATGADETTPEEGP